MKLDDAMNAVANSASMAQAGTAPAADAQAWRREMERAQADAWFHDFVGTRHAPVRSADHARPPSNPPVPKPAGCGGGEAPPTLALPVQQAVASRPMVSSGSGLLLAYQAASGHSAVATAASGVTLAASIRPANLMPANAATSDVPLGSVAIAQSPFARAAGERVTVAVANAEASPVVCEGSEDIATSKPRAAQQESVRLPVRVHVEGDDRHATVWLGLDAHSAVDVPALTRAVAQWLAQAGYGRPTWICNGQPLDPDIATLGPTTDDRASHELARRITFIECPQGESS